MALFKISKGLKANLPITKTPGYCWFTIDDHLFYIDYEDSNGIIQRAALNAKDAKTLTGASLETILNSSDLEIPTSKAVLDTIEALETVVANKANESDLTSHINNKNNPHEVTKTQVGLGNVPNVATNDQTPTYTQASTLATLTSGEKLSVSFGKIMKAISDLISHIGNKSNPHEVTLTQLGVNATATELNYIDGATSNIQTQIDNKASVTIREW